MHSSECISWLAVGITESVVIVTLNFLTVIVFVKSRSPRKRSMYLVINLAVADMLVGGISTVMVFFSTGDYCNIWKYNLTVFGFWDNFIFCMDLLFPLVSITNLAAISLERMHATFCPFRHRVIKKWVFGVFLTVNWVTAALLSTTLVVIRNISEQGIVYFYTWCSFNSICLIVICVSYALIVVKIYCGAHPQHHGAASREKKVTKTLLLVTVVSLLMWLPFVMSAFLYFATDIFSSLSDLTFYRLNLALILLYQANSLVNPILYTFRMPEFKRALASLLRCRPQQGQVALPRFFPKVMTTGKK